MVVHKVEDGAESESAITKSCGFASLCPEMILGSRIFVRRWSQHFSNSSAVRLGLILAAQLRTMRWIFL